MAKGEGLDAMFCDLETGICGPADQQEGAAQAPKLTQLRPPAKKVDLYYFTDPICSHCWAVEPVLRRFEHEYGDHLNLRVIMGGLLPNWDGFADRANGIRGAAGHGSPLARGGGGLTHAHSRLVMAA